MEKLHHIYDSAWEAAHNVALKVIDGGLLHQDAPFSPGVPHWLAEDMPDLTERIPLTLPWDRIHPIDPEQHYVWLFDNTAFKASSADQDAMADIRAEEENVDEVMDISTPANPNAWQTNFTAAYFMRGSGKDISRVVAHICSKLGVDKGEAPEQTIRHRVQHFVDTVLPRHTVEIAVNEQDRIVLGPSSSSGISAQTEVIAGSSTSDGQIVASTVPAADDRSNFLPSQTRYAGPTGWGIISDIDDTIKITMTNSPLGILKTTFLDEPQPVEGMPELYAHIKTTKSDPAIFYLSASPYNLYPFLRSFRTKFYPFGSIILRDASWQNLGGLISSLTQDVQDYKVHQMHKIHAWFPQRKFICIGDSTQKDPESYGEIARTFPGWVRAIFIHKVDGVSDLTDPNQRGKDSDSRFEKAFEGLDRSMWHVFTKPDDVAGRIDELCID